MNISIKVSTLGIIQVALIVLKYCNVINISWVTVFIPAMIYLAFYLFVLLVVKKYVKKVAEEMKIQTPGKSKWAERLEEMQKLQAQRKQTNAFTNVGE